MLFRTAMLVNFVTAMIGNEGTYPGRKRTLLTFVIQERNMSDPHFIKQS